MTISVTDRSVFISLRNFILSVLPTGVEVVKGQDNRVPEPESADFVIMTPVMRIRLSTNTHDYLPDSSQEKVSAGYQVTVQLDVHGPNSADYAHTIAVLFRDDYASYNFSETGLGVYPLYADNPRQIPFVNGEQQVEQRWILDVQMQISAAATISQEFFDSANIGVINVDAEYK